jgi:hypothetical protein
MQQPGTTEMASIEIPQYATRYVPTLVSTPVETDELICNLRRQAQIVANLIGQIEREARVIRQHSPFGDYLINLAELADHASCGAIGLASDLFDRTFGENDDKAD